MYKHTFYYFLGNKKYPEIYILHFHSLTKFYLYTFTQFSLYCILYLCFTQPNEIFDSGSWMERVLLQWWRRPWCGRSILRRTGGHGYGDGGEHGGEVDVDVGGDVDVDVGGDDDLKSCNKFSTIQRIYLHLLPNFSLVVEFELESEPFWKLVLRIPVSD